MIDRSKRARKAVHVLLADDDEGDRLLLHEAWQACGIPVELKSVASGRELMDHLAREQPDLILLDLEMPGMDGRDVLAELRGRSALRRIPVVMLSSRAAGPHVDLCYALGARSYISKPHSFNELVGVVRALADYWFGTVRLPARAGGPPEEFL